MLGQENPTVQIIDNMRPFEPNQIDSPLDSTADSFEDANSVTIRSQIALSDADFERTKNGLKELVLLRNDLVHHFIDRYDLESLDGCCRGRDALVNAFAKIDHHFDELRAWADDMQKLHGLVAQVVQSDEFRDFVVTGMSSDETLHLPNARIVRITGSSKRVSCRWMGNRVRSRWMDCRSVS